MNFYRSNKPLCWLIVVSTAMRILFGLEPLGNGEAYYARGAMDLQLSYFDQPPLFLWLAGLFVKAAGFSSFVLRLPSILFFIGTTLLIYRISLDLYSSKSAAFFSALALNTSAVFTLSTGVFLQPDAPLIFFWLLSFYALLKIFFPSRETDNLNKKKSGYFLKWSMVLGLSLGLTGLSKYHVVFFVAGVIIFMLLNKDYRGWFLRYPLYLSLLVALLVFSPVLAWNYENNWVSFLFQAGRAGTTESSLRFDWLLRSIGGQALWVLPWIWVPLVIQIPALYKKKDELIQRQLLFWTAIPVIVFFTIVTLWSDLQYHFHWQAPGYLLLFIPLGRWIDRKMAAGHKKAVIRYIVFFTSFTVLLLALLFIQTRTGFLTRYAPKLAKDDPTALVNDFAAVKEKFEEKGWMGDTGIFVGSTRWWLAGLVDYSLKYEKDFLIFSPDPRNYAYLSYPRKLLGKNCIIVISGYQSTVENDVVPFFDNVQLVDSCWIERWEGEQARKMDFYYCTNFRYPDTPMPEIPIYAQLHDLPPFSLMNSRCH